MPKTFWLEQCYLRAPPAVWIGMGLVITPLETPRRLNPLEQSMGASQKLGGRELIWHFDGGDITSDGGVLVVQETGGAHGNRAPLRRLLHRLPQGQSDRTPAAGSDYAACIRTGAGLRRPQ